MTDKVDAKVEQQEMFERQKSKEEMQKQLISFGLMILFTLVAFGLVIAGDIGRAYIVPVLFVMALVQAGFQFYYFMHLKDKGHAFPALLIYGGVWAAFLTLAGLAATSWW